MKNLSVDDPSLRLLILSPFGKDAAHLSKVLGAEGFRCHPCKNMTELVGELASPVGAIVTTEEILTSPEMPSLIQVLEKQPTWSALPILGFYSPLDELGSLRSRSEHSLQELTEVVFLPRPVSARTLLSAVRSAVKDRMRQYRTRDLLHQLEQDLAQQKIYESKLKKANFVANEAKMLAQSANQSKSQFLANMSHEIRTPLGAIMGFADLISQRETTREEIEGYASVIGRNSGQLLRIIDDILDLSKVEAGRLAIEQFEFSLAEMLTDFSSLLGLRAREKGIRFDLTATSPLPDRICSDSVRLRQILINVVGNAIKFTEKGLVHLAVSYENGILEFLVRDTGRGISKDQSKALFQPFVQADVSTTREFGGTGLGLVLTRRLCQAMGGDFLLLESSLGKGSLFLARVQVEVPDSAVIINGEDVRFSAPPLPAKSFESSRLTGMNVLLVEDSPDNQALIRILLSKAGAKVETASDGLSGMERAVRGDFSVVLMDIQMPQMDGLEATRLLRANGFQTPIVALTAHAMKEERARCLQAGFSYFLPKPVERNALLDLLEEIHLKGPGNFQPKQLAQEPSPPDKKRAVELGEILVVGDDRESSPPLSEKLKAEGYQVAGVKSAEDALAYLASNEAPKMILLDLTLPQMSGAEFLRRLNGREDRAKMKILITSGWDQLPKKTRVFETDGFLRQPIDLSDFDTAVESFLLQ